MKIRIISSVVLLVAVIPLVIIGGLPFSLLVGVVGFLVAKEITDLYKIPLVVKILALIALISIVYSNFDPSTFGFGLDYRILSFVVLLLGIPIIFFQVKGKYTVNDAFELIGFVLLMGIGLSYIILIRNFDIKYFLLMILIPMVTDSFAYLSGVLIGKHKVTKLSPKKSWEGYIIGSLMGTFIMTIYYTLFINEQSNLLVVIGIILIMTIIGQIGDLFFSAIKRQYDIKDFSNIIPGHGGVIDRLDSIIFVTLIFIIFISYL